LKVVTTPPLAQRIALGLMHPTQVATPFHRPGWVYEEKVDGYRMAARKTRESVNLISRNGIHHAKRFPELVEAETPSEGSGWSCSRRSLRESPASGTSGETRNPTSVLSIKETQAVATALRLKVQDLPVSELSDLEGTFARFSSKRGGALLVPGELLFMANATRITRLAVDGREPVLRRRQAGRPARRAANKVRSGHQPQSSSLVLKSQQRSSRAGRTLFHLWPNR
jgi:hypothetical protein